MFVERFMAWSVTAGSHQRAEAINNLAKTYLSDSIADEELAATEQIFILYLNDPCSQVRLALAKAIAKAEHAPRVLVWGLSQDIAEVASVIFEHSPVLKMSDFANAIKNNDPIIQTAIAKRQSISGEIVRDLVENAGEEAILALLKNQDVVLGLGLKHDIAVRLGHVAEVRDFLLEETDLAPMSSQLLVQHLSKSLLNIVSSNNWDTAQQMENVTNDATNRAAIEIAESVDNDLMSDYVEHLLHTDQLTPALLIRAICEGNLALFENAMASVSGSSLKRVQAIVDSNRPSAFRALYNQTGLPENAYPVFTAAIAAWKNGQPGQSVLMDIIKRLDHVEGEIDNTLFLMLSRMVTEEHADAAQTYERQLLLAAA